MLPEARKIVWVGLALAALTGGCANVNFDYPKTETTAFIDTEDTNLGRAVAETVASHSDESGFYLLTDGVEALAARVVMAQRAERSIDAQYYLITSDPIGLAFIGALLQAADRGVRVRLLLDDIQTQGYDAGMAALDSHPNFEVRIFNPFAVRGARGANFMELGRVNRRMHNKSFTADNQVTLLGGRNIAAEYFAFRDDVNFGDADVLAIGGITREVSAMFDAYWNHRAAVPIPGFTKMPDDPAAVLEALRQRIAASIEEIKATPYVNAFKESVLQIEGGEDTLTWATYELVYDTPDKSSINTANKADLITAPLAKAVRGAKSELIVMSPYFVPLDSGVEALSELSRSGVSIMIITNSLAATNHSIVHSGYVPARKPLLKNGVRLFEIRPDASISGVERAGMTTRDKNDDDDLKKSRGGAGAAIATMHTKAFIVDRERLFLGSFNWDPRSANINTELGVIINSPELATYAAESVMESMDDMAYEVLLTDDNQIRWADRAGDEEVLLDKEPQTGFWRRFGVGFYRILPVKGQL
jgi:putative cardiolipin synthase